MKPDPPTPKASPHTVATGWKHLDQRLSGGLVRGGLHEWLGVGEGGWAPPLFLLTHLARRAALDAEERGEPAYVVWVGREVWPYPHALERCLGVEAHLDEHGVEPERPSALLTLGGAEDAKGTLGQGGPIQDLLQDPLQDPLFGRSLFVASGAPGARSERARSGGARSKEPSERLWAIDTALRCPSVTAVIADGSGLTMAATRRLQLAAASTKNGRPPLALLVRPSEEIKAISAATTRWHVEREPTKTLDQERGHHPPYAGPQWRITLTRAKGLQKVQPIENREIKNRETEAMGRRRNQPKPPQRALWQLHHHASRPGPPSPLFLHRSVPAPPPQGHAPARGTQDLLPLPHPH